MKNLFGLSLIVLFISSCTCEDKSEPKAIIYFTGDSAMYEEVKGINSDSTIDYYNDYGYLPLSIVSDTTIFLFYGMETVDTLAICYKRNFSFESSDCGFTVILSDFQNLPLTTFNEVTFWINETTDGSLYDSNKNTYTIEILN